MKIIIALEKLIKTLEVSISVSKAKLLNHESGAEKLTLMSQASIENNIIINEPRIKRYQELLKELEKYDEHQPHDKDRLVAAIERKKHYKNSKPIYTDDVTEIYNEKIDVMMIMDELPDQTIVESKELFQIALKSIEHYFYTDIKEEELNTIQKEFDLLIKDLTDMNIKDLEMFNYMIPIVVLHFTLLIDNIKKEMDEEELKSFNSFPKYQGWWIGEMWTNHHAYFCLFNWKKNILDLCKSDEQKEGWNLIFYNWILVKVLLFEKGEMAFEYNYAFDQLMDKFANVSEELDVKKLGITEDEIDDFLKNENLFSLKDEHHVLTPYLKYKMDNVS